MPDIRESFYNARYDGIFGCYKILDITMKILDITMEQVFRPIELLKILDITMERHNTTTQMSHHDIDVTLLCSP
jgi:hypothetical protein